MSTPEKATLSRAISRLTMIGIPILVVYLALLIALLSIDNLVWRVLVLGAAGVSLLVLVRQAAGWLVKVPPNHALLVEERLSDGVGAWLTGWHVNPPGVYNVRGMIALWPRNRTRELRNVIVTGSPPLTLKVTYIIQPRVPRDAARLPRKHVSAGEAARDHRIVGNLYFMAAVPDTWDLDCGDVLERELRGFFGTQSVDHFFTLDGASAAAPQSFYNMLNAYLDGAFAALGYRVEVRTMQALNMDGPGAAIWQQRVLQNLIGVIGSLPTEQALVVSEVYKTLAGTMGGRGGGFDPATLLWLQMFQNGQHPTANGAPYYSAPPNGVATNGHGVPANGVAANGYSAAPNGEGALFYEIPVTGVAAVPPFPPGPRWPGGGGPQ